MDFQKSLQKFKTEIDQEIENQFNIVIKDARNNNPLILNALKYAKLVAMSGGKRIRGALLYCGYKSAGGRDRKKIMKAAAAVELAHLFILIHDDIIDHGILRHGIETLHEKFSKTTVTGLPIEDARHFGESLAIITGDFFYAILNKIILEAGFEHDATVRGLMQIQKIAIMTAIGQVQDIAIGCTRLDSQKQLVDARRTKKITPIEVLTMYKNKTARYTFEGPIWVGMIFAGCKDKKVFDKIGSYAIPIGIAFQIQDDILGIFGNEKKLGKSVASDITEGKNTLLVVKARKLSTPEQRKQLDEILGKNKLSKKEIATFKKILVETGALAYAQKIAGDYLIEGKKNIQKACLSENAGYFLTGLVEYLEKRDL